MVEQTVPIDREEHSPQPTMHSTYAGTTPSQTGGLAGPDGIPRSRCLPWPALDRLTISFGTALRHRTAPVLEGSRLVIKVAVPSAPAGRSPHDPHHSEALMKLNRAWCVWGALTTAMMPNSNHVGGTWLRDLLLWPMLELCRVYRH
ncbi:hypothetical protein LZ30DRAFT_215142 [Colletotrichum cereale]|nr:hypothetical protein LZ30DRAFT_215142 [Colletotrichum cereale]